MKREGKCCLMLYKQHTNANESIVDMQYADPGSGVSIS